MNVWEWNKELKKREKEWMNKYGGWCWKMLIDVRLCNERQILILGWQRTLLTKSLFFFFWTATAVVEERKI